MNKTPTEEADPRDVLATPGIVIWHSSDEDGGPDVGVEMGLGEGWSLYFGELSNATLLDFGVDLSGYRDGWWAVLWGRGKGEQHLIGAIPEPYMAREAMDQIAALIRAPYADRSRLQAERDRAVNVMDGLLTGDQPSRPDLALGAVRCAMGVTTDGEVKPWLQTAIDFLTGDYEPPSPETTEGGAA